MRPGGDPQAAVVNATNTSNESILANPCYLLENDDATDDVSHLLFV